MSAPQIDPLDAHCFHCGAQPGQSCTTPSGRPCKPHAPRVRLAPILTAALDPALDAFFPLRNPCQLCGSGLPQRHRMVDAIAGALEAGETEQDVAEELRVPLAAVKAVMAWAGKYPGAWR